MRILDSNNKELTNPDMSLGRLEEDKVFIAHHEAVEPIEEVGHYEVVAEYPNGGKDVKWIIDTHGVSAKEAWDEYETVLRYVLYTEEELAAKSEENSNETVLLTRIIELEKQLMETKKLLGVE